MTDTIAIKLKTLRKGRKLSQVQLAEKMNLTRVAISNYETGRRVPHINLLKKFAEFYGVGLDYFGVASTDEVFDLVSRAREVFNSEDVPKEKKEELYKEFMKLYLSME